MSRIDLLKTNKLGSSGGGVPSAKKWQTGLFTGLSIYCTPTPPHPTPNPPFPNPLLATSSNFPKHVKLHILTGVIVHLEIEGSVRVDVLVESSFVGTTRPPAGIR